MFAKSDLTGKEHHHNVTVSIPTQSLSQTKVISSLHSQFYKQVQHFLHLLLMDTSEIKLEFRCILKLNLNLDVFLSWNF